jgi:hypothetical protein
MFPLRALHLVRVRMIRRNLQDHVYTSSGPTIIPSQIHAIGPLMPHRPTRRVMEA